MYFYALADDRSHAGREGTCARLRARDLADVGVTFGGTEVCVELRGKCCHSI